MNCRIVKFPKDYSIGTLYLTDNKIPNEWTEFGEARGEIIVPQGKCLDFYYDGSFPLIDFFCLSNLAPDDLHGVSIVSSGKISDEVIQFIKHLTGLEHLPLWETAIGDNTLLQMKSFIKLRWLDVSDTNVTDKGLTYLQNVQSLEGLAVSRTKITKSSLHFIAELPNLKKLCVTGNNLDNSSIGILKTFTKLKYLNIWETNITQSGFNELSNALPDCKFRYSE